MIVSRRLRHESAGTNSGSTVKQARFKQSTAKRSMGVTKAVRWMERECAKQGLFLNFTLTDLVVVRYGESAIDVNGACRVGDPPLASFPFVEL